MDGKLSNGTGLASTERPRDHRDISHSRSFDHRLHVRAPLTAIASAFRSRDEHLQAGAPDHSGVDRVPLQHRVVLSAERKSRRRGMHHGRRSPKPVGNCLTIEVEVDVKFTYLWIDARCATEAAVVDFFAVVVSRPSPSARRLDL